MKKVLLIVIDALATRVVRPALADGRLPHLKRLVDAGEMAGNCVPIFPSITPAATCGIVTGCYPRQSGITGAYFYDTKNDHVYYYGDDFWVILQKGLDAFFDDFLKRLNFELLACETLFERVERAGGRAGCINYLWFRGDKKHDVKAPWLLRLLPGVSFDKTVGGPEILCLGDFVTTEPERMDKELGAPGGPFHRFGFDDESTAAYLLELIENARLPDLTLAYFPDNDYRSHEVGPEKAVTTLENFDETLGKLFERFGGLEAMLADVAVVITGDHSQTDMLDEERGRVDLEEVLHGFELVGAGESWDGNDELMVCSNMRAAQIYLRPGYWPRRDRIVEQLLAEQRVDQVILRCDLEGTQETEYCVATRDRGTLRFRIAPHDGSAAQDQYGGRWIWDGNLEAVGGSVDGAARLRFAEYPNAFERIAGSFRDDVGGDLWVTARPGCELHTPRTSYHPGGSHGALHIMDSEIPLILAGAPDHVVLPDQPRTVDVAPLCLAILGIPSPRPVGASHVGGGA